MPKMPSFELTLLYSKNSLPIFPSKPSSDRPTHDQRSVPKPILALLRIHQIHLPYHERQKRSHIKTRA